MLTSFVVGSLNEEVSYAADSVDIDCSVVFYDAFLLTPLPPN